MNIIEAALERRILILDGAMGTMIQQHQLTEKDFRGEPFKGWSVDLKGNNDILSITQPKIITAIHEAYYEAGADIIETNTFSSTSIAMADYAMQDQVVAINKAAVACAQKARENYYKKNGRDTPKFIAGAMGPLNKTLSLSPDVNNPAYRAVSFDEVAMAYAEQIQALVEAGVDILLVETIFDTLNAKAAIYAIKNYFHQTQQKPLPIMISGTITDSSGRTLSGQTVEAFYISVAHANPLSIGLNCALGAKEMKPHIEELSDISACFVSAYPNAGLPNAMGEYDEKPADTSFSIENWAKHGWVNIVGGCCGTTPAHIAAIANAVKNVPPRKRPIQAR